MSQETVDVMVSRISEYLDENPDDGLECLWHGGEPSLMPLSFWEYVEQAFGDLDAKRISRSVQSNLVGLGTREMAKWWTDRGYRVGSSLDGGYEFHYKGRGLCHEDYSQLLENIQTVRALGGSIGVICVVSEYHLGHSVELLEFFESLGVNVRFNMVDSREWSHRIGYSQYHLFLMAIGRAWLDNGQSRISVEPIESDIARFFGDATTCCDRTSNCYDRFLAIDPDGSVYPCNRFASHPSWKYGNLRDMPLSRYWGEVADASFSAIRESFEDCRQCSWLRMCGGGCKVQRAMESRSQRKEFCQSTRTYFEALARLLESKGSRQ